MVIETVTNTYLSHKRGETNNPDSYFLTFDDNPRNRIIALPSSINSSETRVAGIKWIASYPGNIEDNLQRASATLALNDYDTGYPKAYLEASQISAHRTAASGAVAVDRIARNNRSLATVGIVGCGVLSQKTLSYLLSMRGDIQEVVVFDQVSDYAQKFAARNHCETVQARAVETVREAFNTDLVVLATTAPEPHISLSDIDLDAQIILHISLRDLSIDVIESVDNVVDDIDHCLKAQTSCHLAEQKMRSRQFIDAEIADLIDGTYQPDPGEPVVISPFGLGVLDLALGNRLFTALADDADTTTIPDFLPNMSRI